MWVCKTQKQMGRDSEYEEHYFLLIKSVRYDLIQPTELIRNYTHTLND